MHQSSKLTFWVARNRGLRASAAVWCPMFHGTESFLSWPDCACFIFAGYLAFMWGMVELANYFHAVNDDDELRGPGAGA